MCLYLASRLRNASIASSIRDSGKAEELSFLFNDEVDTSDSSGYISTLQGMSPNAIPEGTLAEYLETGLGKAQVIAD